MNIIFYNKIEAQQKLKESNIFKTYIDNINPVTSYTKTNKIVCSINTYLRKLENFTAEEKEKILKTLNSVDNCSIVNSKWEFVKLSTQIEKGWPFTVDNMIVLNRDVIKSSFPRLKYTLCHEKIHTLQAKFPIYFNKFIESIGYQYITIKGINKVNNYVNPDALQIEGNCWVLNHYGELLVPLMIMSNNRIYKKLFKIYKNRLITESSIESIPIMSRKYPDAEPNHCYHPNEVLADIGARYLLRIRELKDRKFTDFFDGLNTLKF